MGMVARAAALFLWIDEISKCSVDALDAVHKTGFLEVLQGSEDSHAVEFTKVINEFTMRKGMPGF
jgi:hypothetical protein